MLDQDPITTRARVRSDGRIELPILGEVEARGRALALRAELEARYKDYFKAPSLILNLEEVQPTNIAVLGEVTRPGGVTVDSTTTIVQALALAGGVTEFATLDRVFVLRGGPTPLRIRFTYEAICAARARAPRSR